MQTIASKKEYSPLPTTRTMVNASKEKLSKPASNEIPAIKPVCWGGIRLAEVSVLVAGATEVVEAVERADVEL